MEREVGGRVEEGREREGRLGRVGERRKGIIPTKGGSRAKPEKLKPFMG